MAYAEVADVRARAGVLAPGFDQGSVSDPEIDRFLDDVAAEIDALIAAAGFPTPVVDTPAVNALRGPNAEGALVLAVRGKWPSSDNGEAKTLLADAQARYSRFLDGLRDETGTIILYLKATSGGAAVGATDFWTENPDYGMTGNIFVAPANPYLAPSVARTDQF